MPPPSRHVDQTRSFVRPICEILVVEEVPKYFHCRYVQYGDVSPKVDVYAFGVVLYELISAKEAIVKANGSVTEPKGLLTRQLSLYQLTSMMHKGKPLRMLAELLL